MGEGRVGSEKMPEISGLMRGKRGLITGVANQRSLAWGIAKACHAYGAELAFTYQGDALRKRVEPLAKELDAQVIGHCDVTEDAEGRAAYRLSSSAATQARAAHHAPGAQAVTSEALESIISVLIGVNVQDAEASRYLRHFHTDAGFTQYVELDKADAQTLARLAQFLSRSILAQSQLLGTGGTPQPLVF